MAWPHFDLFHVHRGVIDIVFPTLDERVLLRKDASVLIWPDTRFQGGATTRTAWASVQHFALQPGVAPPFHKLIGRRLGFTLLSGLSRSRTRDVERALELARRPSSRITEVMRPALLALILAEGGAFEARTDGDSRRIEVGRFQSWLHANLHRSPAVTDLARLAGLSPSRFRTIFKRENGRTVGEFLKSAREAEARQLLVDTPFPLKAIAEKLGYGDAVAFSRAVKSRVGLTPGEFRRSHTLLG